MPRSNSIVSTEINSSRGRVRILLFSLAGIAVLLVAAALIWSLAAAASGGPRFVPLQTALTAGRTLEYCNWLDADFGHDGKIWIWGRAGKRNWNYLYDLRKNSVVGEVLNGSGITLNGDGSKLLCSEAGQNPSASQRLLEQVNAVIARLRHRRVPNPPDRFENCWLLNLKSNTAERVGTLKQHWGSGSSWKSSPNHRFAFNHTSVQFATKMFWVFDFETGQMRELPCKYFPRGWWDDQNVLMSDNGEVTLYNVLTGATATLLSTEAIDAFTDTNKLVVPNECTVICEWHGHQYDFYLAPSHPYATNKAFLAEIQRSEPRLKLIARDFEHRWAGYLNADETLYVYPGETGRWGKGGDGSVMLRDMRDNTVRALVPPGGTKQYSLCRFIEGGVIYSTNLHLWRMDLNGSNNVPLLGSQN